jgi:glycosyltransferase involved in cell wall biosynthesis
VSQALPQHSRRYSIPMIANADVGTDLRCLLTAIVPVGNLDFDLDRFKSWVCEAAQLGIKVILILNLTDTKDSERLKDKFQADQVDLEIVFCERKSPGFARNIGLEISRSKWIAFWDADDLPNPTKSIEALNVSQDVSEIIVNEYERIDFKTHKPLYESNLTTEAKLRWKDLGIWRMLFRTDLINQTRFRDFQMAEDQFFFAEIMEKRPNIYFSRINNYKYFVNNDHQITNNQKAVNEIVHTQTATSKYIRENTLRNSYMMAYLIRQTYTCVRKGSYLNKLRAIGNLIRITPNISLILFSNLTKIGFKNVK